MSAIGEEKKGINSNRERTGKKTEDLETLEPYFESVISSKKPEPLKRRVEIEFELVNFQKPSSRNKSFKEHRSRRSTRKSYEMITYHSD